MAFLKPTEHSDRDSFGTPVDYSNFIQPGSKGRRGIKKGRNILWTNFYKIYVLPNKKPLNREWERKGCRLIEAEVGDCLKEVCAENSELAPYHNNYSSTMSQLFVSFIGHIVTTVQHFLTKFQNLNNRPNIVGGSNFSPIMWTQNDGLKNGDRICCQIRLVLNQMFQIFSSHGSS